MADVTDEATGRTPLDQAVELALCAPLGFALEAKKLLPSFVERGRQQVAMAKMIGEFAVKQGQTEAGKRMSSVHEQAEAILGEFGLLPRAQGTDAVAPAPDETSPSAPAVARVRSSAAAADLPIADYDSLAASQVIPRLAGLADDEIDAVRAYEIAHRGRKTILGKIAQLTGE